MKNKPDERQLDLFNINGHDMQAYDDSYFSTTDVSTQRITSPQLENNTAERAVEEAKLDKVTNNPSFNDDNILTEEAEFEEYDEVLASKSQDPSQMEEYDKLMRQIETSAKTKKELSAYEKIDKMVSGIVNDLVAEGLALEDDLSLAERRELAVELREDFTNEVVNNYDIEGKSIKKGDITTISIAKMREMRTGVTAKDIERVDNDPGLSRLKIAIKNAVSANLDAPVEMRQEAIEFLDGNWDDYGVVVEGTLADTDYSAFAYEGNSNIPEALVDGIMYVERLKSIRGLANDESSAHPQHAVAKWLLADKGARLESLNDTDMSLESVLSDDVDSILTQREQVNKTLSAFTKDLYYTRMEKMEAQEDKEYNEQRKVEDEHRSRARSAFHPTDEVLAKVWDYLENSPDVPDFIREDAQDCIIERFNEDGSRKEGVPLEDFNGEMPFQLTDAILAATTEDSDLASNMSSDFAVITDEVVNQASQEQGNDYMQAGIKTYKDIAKLSEQMQMKATANTDSEVDVINDVVAINSANLDQDNISTSHNAFRR